MSAGRQFSIRYKILILLTVIPLIVLVLYLVLAVNVFKDDKIAYVFESSTSVAKTLSSQTTTELNAILNTAKPIMQEFLLRGSFGDVAQGTMAVDGPILWISAFKLGPQGTKISEKVDVIERAQNQAGPDLQAFGNITDLLIQVQNYGRLFRVPFKDDRVLIIEKVGEAGRKSR